MDTNSSPAQADQDPGETGYTGYWRAAHEAGVTPFAWDEIPVENQDAWRDSAADVLAKHGPAGLRAAMTEIRKVRDALHEYASGWTDAAASLEAKRRVIDDGPDRAVLAAQAEMLRRCARMVRDLAPILLEMDALPNGQPSRAGLIPERVDRAAPGTAAGGTL